MCVRGLTRTVPFSIKQPSQNSDGPQGNGDGTGNSYYNYNNLYSPRSQVTLMAKDLQLLLFGIETQGSTQAASKAPKSLIFP